MNHPLVPLNDLARCPKPLADEIHVAVDAVLASGRYLFGPQVAAFETAFADYCGVRNCVSVGNGTDALEIALRALGCGPGAEVVTVANAGMYASAAIVAVGARPVFADVDPVAMTMEPQSLARVLGPRSKAIVATHLYGRMADIEGIKAVARERDVAIVEDCAQAHGARLGGRSAGSFGVLGCFSFYPTKNLGAAGDGGAIITDRDDFASELRSLSQYGWREKYHATRPHGRNSRLDALQAAVLLAKLPHLDRWNARRRDIVARYHRAAGSAVSISDASGTDYVAHLCVARSSRRDELRERLRQAAIQTGIHYPVPDHRQAALSALMTPDVSLPITERLVGEILTLPCFPDLTESEIDRICDALSQFR